MIDCKELANKIKDNLKEEIRYAYSAPVLAIIQVGDDPASSIYVKNKLADCAEIGIPTQFYKLPTGIYNNRTPLRRLISKLNTDETVKGIVLQYPLPKEFDGDEEEVSSWIADEKDIDGFKSHSKFTPATPRGIMELLDHYNLDLNGKHVVLLGRGKTVGEPLIPLLLKRNATLSVCHSHTDKIDMMNLCSNADIIITATGNAESLTKEMIGDNHYPYIIDVGISRVDGKQVGDVAKELHDITACTPWTGGVGLLTRVALLENLLEANR